MEKRGSRRNGNGPATYEAPPSSHCPPLSSTTSASFNVDAELSLRLAHEAAGGSSRHTRFTNGSRNPRRKRGAKPATNDYGEGEDSDPVTDEEDDYDGFETESSEAEEDYEDGVQDVLFKDLNPSTIREKYQRTLDTLDRAYAFRVSAHKRRLKYLSARGHAIDRKIHTYSMPLEAFSTLEHVPTERFFVQLDRDLVTLSTYFYATLEDEKRLFQIEKEIEDKKSAKLTNLAKCSLYFDLFSHHLAHETAGRVVYRHLAPTNPQFNRCMQAALDNMKGGFFDGTDFEAINVLDVCRIENKILLRRFEEESSKINQGTIKGLFGILPQQCVERAILYGFLDPSEFKLTDLFYNGWELDNLEGKSYIRELLSQSKAVEMPFRCSRHSTLEGERRKMKEGQTHLLLLSRVIAPPKGADGVVHNTSHCEVDSNTGEYLLKNPAHILPEYVITMEYVARKKKAEPSIVEVDFSTESLSADLSSFVKLSARASSAVSKNSTKSDASNTAQVPFAITHKNAQKQRSQILKLAKDLLSQRLHEYTQRLDAERVHRLGIKDKAKEQLSKEVDKKKIELMKEQRRLHQVRQLSRSDKSPGSMSP